MHGIDRASSQEKSSSGSCELFFSQSLFCCTKRDDHAVRKMFCCTFRAVPTDKLVIGFGALYAAWGGKNCGGPGPEGINQTGCLAKSLAACKEAGVASVAVFEINVFGCKTGAVGCQIAGPWPPESWWPLLQAFVKG